MSKEVSDLQVYNSICEAVACSEKATTKINVGVGNLGSISLHLCTDCVRKFDQKERMLESLHRPVSNTNQIIQSSSTRGNASRK